MRGGGSRLDSGAGGAFTRRRRERYNRGRQRDNPVRWPPDDEPWEGDDEEPGTTG
jgi:hypothetical protein